MVELLRNPPRSQAENEDGLLRRKLIEAAWKHDAEWLLGIDADERLEDDFRQRAEEAMRRADLEGHCAYWLHLLELWESARYRVDGIWGTKRRASLFRSSEDHQFHSRRIHTHWASLPEPDGSWPAADLRIYHLRMIDLTDRLARVESTGGWTPTVSGSRSATTTCSTRRASSCATSSPVAGIRRRGRQRPRPKAIISPRAGSSVGQSSGLIIRRSEVRILPGPSQAPCPPIAVAPGPSRSRFPS